MGLGWRQTVIHSNWAVFGLILLLVGLPRSANAQQFTPLSFKPDQVEVVEGIARNRLFLSQADIERFLSKSLAYQACDKPDGCHEPKAPSTRHLTPAQRAAEQAIEEQNRKDPQFGLRYGMESLKQLRQYHDMQNSFLAIASGTISEADLQRNGADATRRQMYNQAVYGYCGAADSLGLFPSGQVRLANGQVTSLCAALISMEVYAANELLVGQACGPLDHKMVPFSRKFTDSRTAEYAECRRARDLDLALRYSAGYLIAFRNYAEAKRSAQHVLDCKDGRLTGKDCSTYVTLAKINEQTLPAFYAKYLADRQKDVANKQLNLSVYSTKKYEK